MSDRAGIVGVLVVTHGSAATAMVTAVRTLLGAAATAAFEALDVPTGEGREATMGHVREAALRLDTGAGVLVLCDLQGATPANCAVELKRGGQHIEVLCGANLPMLVKVATTARDAEGITLASLAHMAAETAVRSIRLGDGGAA